MESINLFILVTQLEAGGAQKVAITQAKYFHNKGYKVTLCFFYDKSEMYLDLQKECPFDVVNLEAKTATNSYILNLFKGGFAMVKLYRLLWVKKIHIIETLTHYSNVFGIVIAWIARVPVRISSQRNSLEEFPRWFLRLDRIIVNSFFVNKMIAVSESTRKFCIESEGMSPQKLVTIPNGIDTCKYEKMLLIPNLKNKIKEEFNIDEKTRVITTIARFHPQKGYQYLLDAIQEVVVENRNVLFLWVGMGELFEKFEKEIFLRGLSPFMKLVGVRKDIAQLLIMSDIFVLPSLYEGMPNVILEAMACQLPIIATSVDGSNELIIDGESGLLVPPKNPQVLKSKIEFLLSNRQYAISLGQNAYKRVVKDYSEAQMVSRYEKVFLSGFNK